MGWQIDWEEKAERAEEEAERLRNELKRIENIANCGSVDSWMSLSDDQKREWFAVTLHVDSEKAKIIREFHDAWPGGLDEIEAAIKFRDDEITMLREELVESRENDRTAMGYLSAIRDALGFDGDYPALVAHCQEIAPQPPAVSADAKCHSDGGSCGAGGYCDDCHQPNTDAKDAARYRWLRDIGGATWLAFTKRGFWNTSGEVDSAIDAAMQKGGA